MRGHRIAPTQATGSAGDQVWRKRLLGRLNDLDTQDFASDVGLKTDFAQAPALSSLRLSPEPFLANAAAAPQPAGATCDPRPLDQVSGDVVDAWSELDARREKVVLARHSAMHLAQRSRISLFTAGFTGLLGIGTAFGFGVLQILSQSAGVSERAPATDATRAASTGVNRWDGFARSALPVAEAALAAHNTMPAQVNVARVAGYTARPIGQGGQSIKTKNELLLPEPSQLSFSVALDGAGERTALLPLRLSDATSDDQRNTIIVRNLPPGASLSAGIRMKTGEWSLHLDELPELQIYLPAGTPPVVDLDLRVVRPRGDVVARTQIVLTTEQGKGDTLAKAPVESEAIAPPVATAKARAAAPSVAGRRTEQQRLAAHAPLNAQTSLANIRTPHPATRSEAHAALPVVKSASAQDLSDKARKQQTVKSATARKAEEYFALGADFSKEARSRNESPEPKAEPQKSWLANAARPMPGWMPASGN